MKITIKIVDKKKFVTFSISDREEKKVFVSKVIGNDKEPKDNIIIIETKNEDVMDSVEFDIFNKLKNNNSIKLQELTFSRSFIDIHEWEKKFPKLFKESLERISAQCKKRNPQIKIEKKKYWWIGVDNFKLDYNLNLKQLAKDIYRIGFGLGLCPKDMTYNFKS